MGLRRPFIFGGTFLSVLSWLLKFLYTYIKVKRHIFCSCTFFSIGVIVFFRPNDKLSNFFDYKDTVRRFSPWESTCNYFQFVVLDFVFRLNLFFMNFFVNDYHIRPPTAP